MCTHAGHVTVSPAKTAQLMEKSLGADLPIWGQTRECGIKETCIGWGGTFGCHMANTTERSVLGGGSLRIVSFSYFFLTNE